MKKSKKKNIELPTALIEIYDDERQAGIMIAIAAVMDLVRKARISPHMGAEILGMRYEDFAAMVAGEDIPLVDYG